MTMTFNLYNLNLKSYFSLSEEDEKAVEIEEFEIQKIRKKIEELLKNQNLKIITKNVWYLFHNSSKKTGYKQLTSFTLDNKPIGDTEAPIEDLKKIVDKIINLNNFKIEILC